MIAMIGRTVVSTQVTTNVMRHLSQTRISKKLTMTDYTISIGELFVHSSVPLGIPGLATDELRFAFLQATEPLCPDVQRKIWEEVLYCTTPIEPPPAPQKCRSVSYNRSSISLPRNMFSAKNL